MGHDKVVFDLGDNESKAFSRFSGPLRGLKSGKFDQDANFAYPTHTACADKLILLPVAAFVFSDQRTCKTPRRNECAVGFEDDGDYIEENGYLVFAPSF